jgi:hypothetical protein
MGAEAAPEAAAATAAAGQECMAVTALEREVLQKLRSDAAAAHRFLQFLEHDPEHGDHPAALVPAATGGAAVAEHAAGGKKKPGWVVEAEQHIQRLEEMLQ